MDDRANPDPPHATPAQAPPSAYTMSPEVTGGRNVAISTLWWTSTNVLPYLATTVVSIVAARTLGAHLMGQQSFIAFVTLIATEAGIAGMAIAISQSVGTAVGRNRSDLVAPLARWALRVELAVGALGAALLIGIGLAGGTPRVAWALAGLTVMTGIAGRAPAAVLMGLGRWRSLSIAIVAVQIGGGATTVAALLAGGGVTSIVAVRLVMTVVMLCVAWVLARRALRAVAPHPSRDRELIRPTLSYAMGSSVTVLVGLLVYQRTEFFFLKGWSTETEIAFYAIAVSAVAALTALPQSVGVVLFPALSTMRGAGDDEGVRTSYHQAVRLSLLVTIPLAGLAAAVGPALVSLVYGEAYDEARTVLLLLLPTLVFAAVAAPSSAVLIARRKIKLPLYATVAGLAVDLVAAATFVPILDANGAAIANTLAQGTVAALMATFAVSVANGGRIGLRTPARIAVATCAATAAAAIVLAVLGEAFWSAAAAIVVFAIALPVAATVVKPLDASDADRLLAIGGARADRLRPLFARLAAPR
jgi:O-antigen/teichoic acid export membrane protein